MHCGSIYSSSDYELFSSGFLFPFCCYSFLLLLFCWCVFYLFLHLLVSRLVFFYVRLMFVRQCARLFEARSDRVWRRAIVVCYDTPFSLSQQGGG